MLIRNKDGSYATQCDRRRTLLLAADAIINAGYKLNHIAGLKQKHVKAIIAEWQDELTPATLKNRLAHIRWVASKFNKNDMVPSNQQLGVQKRCYADTENKAVELTDEIVNKITDKTTLITLHLQRHLGLRREEAIKIKPHLADKGSYIELQGSWCKNGRPRRIEPISKQARFWLEQAKAFVATENSSLIPEDKKYIDQRIVYDYQVRKAGLKHPHGLRHAYVQERYKEITGFEPPVSGGPIKTQLSGKQIDLDKKARALISESIGHSRIEILKRYCG